MGNKVVEAIFYAIAGGLVTFVAPLLATLFFEDTPEANIGKSIAINENEFILPIDLTTYKDNIEELRITVPINITKEQIKSETPLKISVLDNDVRNADGTDIAINNITSDKEIQLAIISSERFESEEIDITNTGNNINTNLLSEKESPAASRVKDLFLSAILYSILIGAFAYYFINKTDKKYNEVRDHLEIRESEINRLKEDSENTEDKLSKAQSDFQKSRDDFRKRQLVIQAKLYDYRKEINFWRDTIRKMLYQNKIDEAKAEELFDIVTFSLGTYETKGNKDLYHDYEHLKVLSRYVNDIESD
ncbi:hypothetical protein [Thalassobacillus devorans]|uniref:hypothetical protein n=1 Tax=Thalassobacillus devorans TaxID=279813 RepID=UPI000A1CB69F|nr:hypothetical protein [Thalassobacillus devorans]